MFGKGARGMYLLALGHDDLWRVGIRVYLYSDDGIFSTVHRRLLLGYTRSRRANAIADRLRPQC